MVDKGLEGARSGGRQMVATRSVLVLLLKATRGCASPR